ncbi:HCLS1-binding protein 3 [Bombina bombina]|uniref:HCLS1-binding protein 3 n=1 Tax=Bombina bombina TaxID=8345 RepID=UPI00235B13DB|nr:HCLS1-binding protein 3 [Bombina bombina]
MATAALVTSRQIQNAHTGIDLWVPEYQEIRGKMMTGHVEYQIVVVTTLPAFKSAKHKSDDTVQFVVFRKYSELEEFYQKITAHYPNVSLPPFPRKVLFVGESDIRERRAAFNELVKSISKEKELASCPELLEFLGSGGSGFVDMNEKSSKVNQPEDGEFFKNEVPSAEAVLHVTSVGQNEPEEEEEVEEVDFDPLGIIKTKVIKKTPKANKSEEQKEKAKKFSAHFDDEEPGAVSAGTKRSLLGTDDIKLFEEQDLGDTVKLGDSLLLPSSYNKNDLFKDPDEEDNDELFRVPEDFEKYLDLKAKPKTKPKPKIPVKPTLPKVSNVSSVNADQQSKRTDSKVLAMDETDILQYIKDNESADSDSLSLF